MIRKQIDLIKIKVLFLLLIYVSVVQSCRSTDTDHISDSGIANIKINLLRSEYSPSSSGEQASLKKSLNTVNDVQRHTVMINPSTVLIAELSPNTLLKNTLAGTDSKRAVSGEVLPIGIAFRVIAYQKSSGFYKTHQDYVIGQQGQPMILDAGVSYTIVTYSYGTPLLPAINTSETGLLANANVGYDDANRDFMYQSVDYTPRDGNNTIDVVLMHKVSQITTVINSTEMGGPVTAISNAFITPHYSDGTISLINGTINNRNTISKAKVDFSTPPSGSVITGVPVFVNSDTKGSKTGSFTADITMNGIMRTLNATNVFAITPGYQGTLNINIRKCGAYIAPGVWKEFMCHDLGADTKADPFTPSSALQGAVYQWGNKIPVMTQDQALANNKPGEIPNWPDNTNVAIDAWQDNYKTNNDPCPPGYRVPTKIEWDGVIANNSISRIGRSWATSYDTDYKNGIKFGNGLFLLANGYRQTNGNFIGINYAGLSHSTSESTPPSKNLRSGLTFRESSIDTYGGHVNNGLTIRCIAE